MEKVLNYYNNKGEGEFQMLVSQVETQYLIQ